MNNGVQRKTNERLVVMGGYPKSHGITGGYVFKQQQLVRMRDDISWFYMFPMH